MRWQSVPLTDLAAGTKGAIVGGPFGSDLVSDDYVSEGVPVVRGRNLPHTQRFSYDNLVYVSEAKADALHLNCARPGDLVFTQRGTLGQVGLIPEDSPYPRFLISQSQMKMTVDPLKAEALFLYYYFRLPATVASIENHALQAGVPHINLGILRKLQVLAPPMTGPDARNSQGVKFQHNQRSGGILGQCLIDFQTDLFTGPHTAFNQMTFDQLLRYVFGHGWIPL